jgi:hypothetical protein
METGGGAAAALFRTTGEEAFVIEAAAPENALPDLARAVCAVCGKTKARFRLPGEDSPSGMIYGAALPAGGYLNLTLD